MPEAENSDNIVSVPHITSSSVSNDVTDGKVANVPEIEQEIENLNTTTSEDQIKTPYISPMTNPLTDLEANSTGPTP